ncbi:MAG: hypothetical protein Q4D38_08840 [Planctomycetia bacterium]|nr:hypothetical protein [Planctomycetia bacterium]
MTPTIIIQFDHPSHRANPGESLSGTYRFVDVESSEIQRVELSILWYTEGKGDEDLGVHYFELIPWEEREQKMNGGLLPPLPDDHALGGEFETILPQTPLSYYGKVLKIRWCVRVRLFLKSGRDVKTERVFVLGSVPPAQAVLD